jgi:hypothetical protein
MPIFYANIDVALYSMFITLNNILVNSVNLLEF